MEFTTRLELQSQATRLLKSSSNTFTVGMNGAITLLGSPFQDTLPTARDDVAYTDYISEDSKSELFPLHSPLLGESLLVSFPPLTDMLKFSG